MNQKISPPSQKLDGLFLLALSMAVFFVGVTEFMLSSMLGPLAQAFHTTTSGAAWLISSYAFSYAIAAPLLGYFSDRMQRRKLLLLALILFAVDTLAIVIAPTLEIAVVLRVIGGIASAIIIPTTFALVAEVVAPQRQAGAMGQVMLGMTLGIAAGPALAGLLSDFFGWAAPFLMVSCGCVLVFLMARQRLPVQAVAPRAEGHALGWCRQWSILRPLIAKGAWNGTVVALGLGAPAGTVVLASRSGPDKGMVLSFAETFNNIAILASVPLAVRLLELKGPPATLWVLGIGLGIGAWLTVLDWFASRRSDEALPLRD
ncbi:MFS transporter [Pseudomonas aeruginosa]|nr:MFS transporter [Pseudomonas aeruginosa]